MSNPTPIPQNQTADQGSWIEFWFGCSASSSSLIPVQLVVGCISAWFFASHFQDAAFWFGPGGILSPQQVAGFLQDADLSDAVAWQWSPLYLTDNVFLIRVFLALGTCLAILAVVLTLVTARKPIHIGSGVGLAEKWLWLGIWLSVVWLANRSLLISGTEEIALSAATGYLALAQWHVGRPVARRLLQVHACLLMGMGGLQMLASEEWWDGTGSVAVAAPTGRRFPNLADAISEPGFHDPLTHLLVLIALGAPILIWTGRFRAVALWSAIGWCGVMSLLSSQWIYLPTLAAMFLAFRKADQSSVRSDFAEYSQARDTV